jgi:hypothetical protein
MELYSEEAAKPKRFWKLEDISEDTIMLVICDEQGDLVDAGNILRIDKKTGRIVRCYCINSSLGLELDYNGQVKVS